MLTHDAPLLEQADRALHETFGLDAYRPGQRQVVAAVLAGRSALAVFPTGGGKSLCYQLPALLLDGTTVVVSPLVALMKDQLDALRARGVEAARLDSSLDHDEHRSVVERLRSGALRLLYVAPERFNNERFLRDLAQVSIPLFAIDEAHCISAWGHNFRPDYLKLVARARELGAERLLALTATATPQVQADIEQAMGIAPADAVVTGFYRPNLTLLQTPVAAGRRDGLLLERLQARPRGPAIVYVTLQRTAERVAALLAEAGLPARPYHAGLDPGLRHETQAWWQASSDGVVVATIAFGMGIDKADVRYVYHYNQPKSLEAYAQEVGRAGRDGLTSTCELIACADDAATLESFAYGDTPTAEALAALVQEVLAGDAARYDLAEAEVAARLDLRPLVLRTALTYLELDGYLRQGTPYYAAYRLRPLSDLEQVSQGLGPERGAFLRRVLGAARQGRTWLTLEPAVVAGELDEDRDRVVRALEWLAERGHAELAVAEVRQRFAIVRRPAEVAALVAALVARFEARERSETGRVREVLALATLAGCRTNALVGYFGERRDGPCGHCSYCIEGVAPPLPPATVRRPLADVVDDAALAELVAAHPHALGGARQRARFLCGLSSPAAARARIGRHPLAGSLDAYPFEEVLAYVAARPGS